MSAVRPSGRVTRVRVRVYGAVSACAILCYLNSLHGDLVHDDIPAIRHNHDVLGTTPLHHVFLDDFWGTPMGDHNSHKSYRPLTTLTFRLNHWLGGLHPWGFHVCNVFLHIICCLLFTRVALRVARLQTPFAAAAGLIFATHPVHTEAVTGIVGRADVLACVFFLLSFLAYHDDGICSKHNRMWVSSQLAALSMLAKETGVTVLFVNLVYDLYHSWPPVKRSLLDVKWNEDSLLFARRAAKVLMVTSLLLLLRVAMLQGSLPKFSSQDNPAAFHPSQQVRFLTFSYLAVFHCWLLVCPSTLSHDWQMGSVPLVSALSDHRNLATCLLFASCLWMAYRIFNDMDHQRHSPLIVGFLLLTIPFLPASNLVVIVGFVVAERILYIPSMGYIILMVYGAQLLYTSGFLRHKSWILWAVLHLSLWFMGRTVLRNQDWLTREALVRSGVSTLPHNAKMHYNLANFLRDTGQLDTAKAHYHEALRLWPTYASAHNNLGTLMNEPEVAEGHFLAAIRFSPGHVNAHYNLGQVYRKMNRSDDAISMLEKCLRLNSVYAPAFLLLAKIHSGQMVGQLLYHVTKLQPTNADYLAKYASWLRQNYRTTEAMVYYGRALRLKANHRNSIIGAGQTLRDRGQKGRLHQLLIRWHIICRPQSTRRIVYTGDIYIRSWEFYKSGQATTSLPVRSEVKPMRASTPMHVTSLLVTEDRSNLTPLRVGTFGDDKEDLRAG